MKKTFVGSVELYEKTFHCVSVPIEFWEELSNLNRVNRGLLEVKITIGSSCSKTWPMETDDGTPIFLIHHRVISKEKISLGTKIEVSFETRIRDINKLMS